MFHVKRCPLVIFLVGAPATGKSTLARAMMWTMDPFPENLGPSERWPFKVCRAGDRYIAPGHYTIRHTHGHEGGWELPGPFEGADMIGMSKAQAWLAWWYVNRQPVTILDGARFMVTRYADTLEQMGASTVCVHLTLPRLAHERRMGTRVQNSSWAKGQATRAQRFADYFERHGAQDLLTLTGDWSPWGMAREVFSWAGIAPQ